VSTEPEPSRNRRGCYLLIAAVVMALVLIGLLASQTADTVRSRETMSQGTTPPGT
jgi:hypothetical protein